VIGVDVGEDDLLHLFWAMSNRLDRLEDDCGGGAWRARIHECQTVVSGLGHRTCAKPCARETLPDLRDGCYRGGASAVRSDSGGDAPQRDRPVDWRDAVIKLEAGHQLLELLGRIG